MSIAQAEEVERALWAAARALEEAAALSLRLASKSSGDMHQRFLEKAGAQAHQADVIRKLILTGDRLSPDDASAVDSAIFTPMKLRGGS